MVKIPEFVYQGVPLIDRRDLNLNIPVGAPNVQPTPAQQGDELSHLVIAEQEFSVPTTTFEGPSVTLSDAEWYAKMFPGMVLDPLFAQAAPVIVTNQEDDVSIFDDLGDVFVEKVRQEVLGQPSQPLYNQDPGAVGPTVAVGGPGLPPPGMGGQIVCAPEGPAPVWKKVCGIYKWVIPKRRRRRALLSEGDYNALLRIENLKVNKNMTAAIAKALTR